MRVTLLMGGRSGEHAISLASGKEVGHALAALGWPTLALVFEQDGTTRWSDERGAGVGSVAAGLAAMERFRPDVAFIAMHGEDGEDGRIQGALELMGVPYQGSGVQASAVGLDKVLSKQIFRAAGIPVARDLTVVRGEAVDWAKVADDLGLPLMLKTQASGSSVGVERVDRVETLAIRGAALLETTPRLLVEAMLSGREFTVPILELADGALEALPVVEIRPKDAVFFDYEAKYTPGATDEICPAPIDDALRRAIQTLGLDCHEALRCRGYSRTDIMLDDQGRPMVLETNTLPGLTRESLLPKAATAAGITFEALIARLLERAVAK